MAILQGLQVTIKSGGEALKEYEDPDRKIGDVKKNTTMYIEATSGSDYSICVYASPDSKFYEADSLQVHHVLDGHSAKHRHKVSEKLVTSAGGYAIHHETFLDATASNQKEKRIKFGALDALESQHPAGQLSAAQAIKLGVGTITVKVSRATRKRVAPSKPRSLFEFFKAEPDVKAPAQGWVYTTLKDWKGKEIVFNFLYRSRGSLQALRCIPPSPTIPLVVQSVPETQAEHADQQNVPEPEPMERPHIQAPTKPASEPTKEQKDEIHKAVAPITIADDGEPKLQLCKVESKLSETLVVQNPAVSEERRRILAEIARLEDVRTQRLLAELARLDNLEKHHDLESNLILNKRGKTTEVSGDAKIKVGLKRERQGEMHVKREGEVKHRRVKASKPTEIVDLTGGQGAV